MKMIKAVNMRTPGQPAVIFHSHGIAMRQRLGDVLLCLGDMLLCLAVILPLCLAAGCGLTSLEEQSEPAVEDIDFTVLRQSEIPEELAANIETRKEEAFKIAYTDQGYTYIAIGYGAQPTGGYSIMVEECYITETNLCVKTKFLGPETDRSLVQTITYPYIVIKVEDRGLEILYLE